MKVLLVQDVPGQGKTGDLKEVSPGYARNFLLAKHFAVVATASTIADVQRKQESVRKLAEKNREEAQANSDRLKKLTLTMYAKTGEKGKLFGSITPTSVAKEIKREAGITVDKSQVEFVAPIRTLGTHEATVTLLDDVTETVRIVVVAE